MILLSCSVNEARSIFPNESPRINPNVAKKKDILKINNKEYYFGVITPIEKAQEIQSDQTISKLI